MGNCQCRKDGKLNSISMDDITVYPKQEQTIYRAMYDYKGTHQDDLPFKLGDRFRVDETSQDSDWWMATNIVTGKKGYIPLNYVCKDDDSSQAQDWWFDFNRNDSNDMLLHAGNKPGTFLIRESTDKSTHVLSIRDTDQHKKPCVKHYRIKKLDSGEFFLNPKTPFTSMIDLVNHHKQHPDGISRKLAGACPKLPPPVHFRELQVDRSAVQTQQKLGQGCFGEVWKGKLWNILDVAVKSLKPGTMSPEAFLEEANIMHQLRHKKLVQLRAVCSSEEPILIITELMVNGALLDYIRKDRGSSIKFPDLINMASQIAEGMEYLESKNFVHRDLRTANILVGDQHNVKVADFGLARILEDGVDYTADARSRFPIKWTAPEAANYRKFSVKSDVWSFGVLLYELVTFGRVPYPGMSNPEVIRQIGAGYRMPKPSGPMSFPDSYYDVMMHCWKMQPESRPTFAYLHSLFSDYFVSTESGYKSTDEF
ncbi:proto-oncogene tyrosine-protein kinase Src-like isoform X1 [Haliotis cracherodii]|uniref:proto-oncogene tyrosine-protein kinase Src-like isoform X1 n=2 Tax=Haliotis cracherodii TaxID=6455 RepID=UPI0039EA1BA8